jgi:micrococcal nuclease
VSCLIGTLYRRVVLLLICLLLTVHGPADAEVQGQVLYVYDGDTLRVSGLGRVRLIGIDTPENERSDRDRSFLHHGANPALLTSVAVAARTRVLRLVQGQLVKLTFDQERQDRHGRTLAYVTLADGRLLNRLLVEEGYAIVYRRFEFQLKSDFLAAEERARSQGVGMWRRGKQIR